MVNAILWGLLAGLFSAIGAVSANVESWRTQKRLERLEREFLEQKQTQPKAKPNKHK